MNDVQHYEAARGLATRMMNASPESAARIDFAFKSVLSRAPLSDEVAIVSKLYQRQLARYQKAPEDAKKAIGFGESKAPDDLDVSQLAAWTLVANLILNMDEAIVRN